MIGLILLNNPDIEIINSIGAVLMILGYVPFGYQITKIGYLGTSHNAQPATA